MWDIFVQAIGIVGAVCSFASYQFKDKKRIFIALILANVLMAVNYALLGGISGAVLNAVCAVRCVVFCNRDKKIFSHKAIPPLFTVVIAAAGAMSWQNAFSLLVIAALAINNLVLAYCSAQTLRKSLLITCPMMLAYAIVFFSIGGIITELLAIGSAVVGIIRYRNS